MELPVYELTLNDENTGVKAVALVDFPATGLDYQTFKSHTNYDFKIVDEEERVIMGPVMVPNLPIYRNDEERGEYLAVFRKDTIKQIVKQYYKEQRQGAFNEMHSSLHDIDGVHMYQSFLTDETKGILPPLGWENIADGTWFGAASVENDAIWEKTKKDGIYKGFSIEGFFDVIPYQNEFDKAVDKFAKLLKEYHND